MDWIMQHTRLDEKNGNEKRPLSKGNLPRLNLKMLDEMEMTIFHHIPPIYIWAELFLPNNVAEVHALV